jgi:hypothetical protein
MSDASVFELDLYIKITIAWYQAQPRGPHIDRVLRPYVLGTGFAKSVQDTPTYVDLQHVAAICALVVSSETWRLDGLQKVLDTHGIGRAPKDIYDPVTAWWYPLDKASVLGIHYWELANGTLELRLLHRFDRPPPVLLGRFATERDHQAVDPTNRGGRRRL